MMPNNAHWIRSSSSKTCQLHTTDSLTGKILHQSKGHDDSLALEQVNSKEFKLVRVDMNQRYSFGGKGKSGETSEVDRGKFKVMEDFSMRRNMGLINDETAFSEKVSTQHLTESSIKWKKSGSYCCHNLDISESDLEHFSMADINRKIETMSASKKKTAYGVVSVKMVKENLSLCESIGTSSLTAKKIICDAEKVMATYEGFLPDNDDDMDGAPSPVIHGCKYQKTNMVDCMFSSGLTYADPLNNKLTCMQHNLCSCCSSSKAMRTGIKRRIGPISKGFGNSRTVLKGGSTHMLIESSPTDFHHSFSTEGLGSEVKGDSSRRSLLDQRRLRKPDGADVNHLPCKHDMNLPESCQNLKSVDIGERFHKFSSTKKYLLIADKGDKYQCLRERAMGDAAFTGVHGSSSSKTTIIPTKQNYGEKEKSTIPLENFVRDEDRSDWDDTGANLMAEHNEFYTKADTICIQPFHRSSSLLGNFFPRPQKMIETMASQGGTSSNQRYSMPPSASSREFANRNVAAGMAEKREIEQSASTDKANYASHKEASVSRTESLASDHTSGSETWSSWIKRFQQNQSETLPLCTKGFKKGDDSSSGEVQETFSGMQNYNPPSYGSRRFMKEQGKCEKAMALSDESTQLWTRRWCRKHDEVSQTTSTRPNVPLTVHPEESSLEKFEGKMPASIGAMALMGKAMNNYRPCRFWRDEGSLIWNTEE